MSESEYLKLRELAWRRPLTPDEKAGLQSYLLVHPELQRDWEEEVVLNQLLAAVPNAPLSSNFTAQVLQAIDLEERRTERSKRSGNWLHRIRLWLPRFAVAGLVVGVGGGLSYQKYRSHELRQKTEYVGTLVTSVASTFPDARIWEDFDAISRLSEPVSPAKDDLLWAALAPGEQ